MAKKFFVAMAIVAMAFASCTKADIEEPSFADVSYGGPNALRTMVDKNDSLIGKSYVNPFEKIGDAETFGFTPVDVYASGKGVEGEIITFQRPIETGEESLDSLYVSNFDFKTIKAKTTSSKTSWNDGVVLWSGKEELVNDAWEMTNGTNRFDFNTWHKSSDAIYSVEDFDVDFPALNWDVAEETVASEEYMTIVKGNTYRAKDFTSTVTYTASVAEGFGNDVKDYNVVNKLVALIYVEPDPEDEVTGSYTKAWVEKQNDVLVGVVQKWEKHSLIPDVLVETQKAEFSVTFVGTDGEMKDVENVNYTTSVNTWRGTGAIAFYPVAKNGVAADRFETTFTGIADNSKTIMGVLFTAEAVANYASQYIGSATFVEENGQYYNIYPYTCGSKVVYTVSCEGSSASLEKTAEAGRKLRVKAADDIHEDVEDLNYVFEAKAEGNTLTSTKNCNSWTETVYNYGTLVSKTDNYLALNLSVIASKLPNRYFTDKANMGKAELKSITKLTASSKKVKRNGFELDVISVPFEVVMKDTTFQIVATYDCPVDNWLGYAEVINITKASFESKWVSDNEVAVSPKYTISVELHDISKPATKSGENVKNYTIENPYKEVYTETDKLVEKRAEGIATPKANGFDLTANFYEVWSLSGEKLVNTQNGEMTFDITAENGEDVIAENINFTTTSNGMKGDEKGTYSSTMSNGTVKADNNYNWNADKKATFKYDGQTVEFVANFEVVEVSTSIKNMPSDKTVNGVAYDAYPYTNKVQGVYTIKGQSVTKDASVSRDILIAQPIDELLTKRSEGIVTPNGDGFDLTAKFYEVWSLSGEKLVNTQTGRMDATLTGKNGEDVIAENTNFNTTSNGQVGSTSGTYSSTASNGAKSFTNNYNWTADNSKTFSYNGETVSFNGSMVISENGTSIGSASSKTVNGVSYNAYPYKNKVKGVYTVNNKSVTLNASSSRNILVVADNFETVTENYAYSFEAEANGNTLVSSVNDNVWEQNTYNNGVYVSGDKHSMSMNLKVVAPQMKDKTFTDKNEMGKADVKSITKLAASSKRVSRDGIAVDEVSVPFEVVTTDDRFEIIATYDRPVDSQFSYAEVSNITKASCTNVPSGNNVIVTPKYNVSVEIHDNSKPATKSGNVKTYTIENPYNEVYSPVDELVSKRSEGIVTPNGDGFDLTAKFYETWSLSGEKLVNTQKDRMAATLTGKNGEDVIAENTNFNTTSNGQVGSTSGTYSSTASNGAKSFTNNYNWTADNSKTFSYNGETVKFTGSFKVSEDGTNIGNATDKTVDGVAYNAYPYTNKVKGVYTVNGKSITLNASSSRNILVKKETPKVIPDNWGKIVGAAMTAVPAHSIGNGRYADGNGTQIAHKCLAIRTDKGYIPVVFVMENVVPTEAQILAADFTSGNYDASYDSGCDPYKNGKWIPAKAKDTSTSIKYQTTIGTRSISNETLAMWGWRKGQSYSSRVAVDGYTFNVSEDGTLTVIYGSEVVMQIK